MVLCNTRTNASALALFGILALIPFLAQADTIIEVGSVYIDATATAADACEGDLTAAIQTVNNVNANVLGTYSVVYEVSDSSGNTAQATRTVHVVDTTRPVIILAGDNPLQIDEGAEYTDPGAAAFDNYDGNLSAQIAVGGTVDSSEVGIYTLTYNVSDGSGNAAAQVTRTVEVFPAKNDSPLLTIAAPFDGATLYVSSGVAVVPFTITTTTDVEVDSMEYALDGVPFGMASEAPYEAITMLDVAAFGLGQHTLTATAQRTDTQETISTQAALTIAAITVQDDADGNGIPDNPFTTLSHEGDVWMHTVTVPSTGAQRVVAATRFENTELWLPSDTPVSFHVQSANDAGRYITLDVPRTLIQANEAAVLLVELADDLDTLLGADEASYLGTISQEVALADNGQYAVISVITSTDGGASFAELDQTRLAADPIHVEMAWLNLDDNEFQIIGVHPILTTADSAGVYVAGIEDYWTDAGIVNFTVEPGSMAGDLSTLALVAPMQTVTPVAAPTITTTSLPSTKVHANTWIALEATGGTGGYTWSLIAGSLPYGMALSADGVISGKTYWRGTAGFTVQVADANGQTDTQDLSLYVKGFWW